MPKLSIEFKTAIEAIPQKVLQTIVIELAKKSRENYDYLDVNYISKKTADDDLFEDVKELILFKTEAIGYSRARVIQKEITSTLSKLMKEINHYAKVTKNKKREAELLLLLLDEIFRGYAHELGTCWTVFDSRLAIITNRLINLVNKNIHEDYFIEYKDAINHFLSILHEKDEGLNYVFKMPKQIIKR